MIGVDRTETRSIAKAAKSSTASGVAGRNMAARGATGRAWLTKSERSREKRRRRRRRRREPFEEAGVFETRRKVVVALDTWRSKESASGEKLLVIKKESQRIKPR